MTVGPDENLYVADGNGVIRRFNGKTGAFIDTFASGGGLSSPADPSRFGPDGNHYVADFGAFAESKVLRFSRDHGGLHRRIRAGRQRWFVYSPEPAFGPDGNLYVGSRNPGQIQRYDGSTGAFLDIFAESPGVENFTFGPDGDLYTLASVILGGSDEFLEIRRFNGTTGEFVSLFVPPLFREARMDPTSCLDRKGTCYTQHWLHHQLRPPVQRVRRDR
jgi:hypothetical protein